MHAHEVSQAMIERAIGALRDADHAFEDGDVRPIFAEAAARGVAVEDILRRFLARPRPNMLVPALRGWFKNARPDPAAVERDEQRAAERELADLPPEEQSRLIHERLRRPLDKLMVDLSKRSIMYGSEYGHDLGDWCYLCDCYALVVLAQWDGHPSMSACVECDGRLAELGRSRPEAAA